VASTGFNLDSVADDRARVRITPIRSSARVRLFNPKARCSTTPAPPDANSYQLGFYGGWQCAFLRAGACHVGHQDFRNTRPGVVDTITSNPDGTTFVVAGKTGYLFDAGKAQLGPIGGLIYARAR